MAWIKQGHCMRLYNSRSVWYRAVHHVSELDGFLTDLTIEHVWNIFISPVGDVYFERRLPCMMKGTPRLQCACMTHGLFDTDKSQLTIHVSNIWTIGTVLHVCVCKVHQITTVPNIVSTNIMYMNCMASWLTLEVDRCNNSLLLIHLVVSYSVS